MDAVWVEIIGGAVAVGLAAIGWLLVRAHREVIARLERIERKQDEHERITAELAGKVDGLATGHETLGAALRKLDDRVFDHLTTTGDDR